MSKSSAARLIEHNHRFYDALWRDARLIGPQRFNTWPAVSDLVEHGQSRLEVAPGLRPRLPIAGTTFADISTAALRELCVAGGVGVQASVTALPFANASFDLVCAFDIVEHVEDDHNAFAELARVARPGADLLLSVPLHQAAWTPFDAFVGHHRRYEPDDLARKLADCGYAPVSSAVHGMQPRQSRLLDLGMWFLTHQRRRAMWWYNRVFMPIGLRRQQALDWQPGLINDPDVDTVLVICKRL